MQKYASKKPKKTDETEETIEIKNSIVLPKNSGIREAFYEVKLDTKKFTRNKRTRERKIDISNSGLGFSGGNFHF